MPDYIFYLLNAHGVTISDERGAHPNDEDAITWADRLLTLRGDGAAVEVWREAKRVYLSKRPQ